MMCMIIFLRLCYNMTICEKAVAVFKGMQVMLLKC
jgi:hypothetical protein